MRAGGNQAAAYRYLARYTPGRDLPKPVDRWAAWGRCDCCSSCCCCCSAAPSCCRGTHRHCAMTTTNAVTHRVPQHVRAWINTVFAEKRFFSADAPLPQRRSSDASASASPTAASSSSLAASSGSFRRSSYTREVGWCFLRGAVGGSKQAARLPHLPHAPAAAAGVSMSLRAGRGGGAAAAAARGGRQQPACA